MSLLVARTKQWNATELTKTVCTQGPGASLLCARTSLDLDSGTGTVVRPVPGVQIVERGATSGSVRKRGKNKKEERERERGGNRVPLFSPPISPHRFFFLSSAHISLHSPHDLNA